MRVQIAGTSAATRCAFVRSCVSAARAWSAKAWHRVAACDGLIVPSAAAAAISAIAPAGPGPSPSGGGSQIIGWSRCGAMMRSRQSFRAAVFPFSASSIALLTNTGVLASSSMAATRVASFRMPAGFPAGLPEKPLT